MNSFAQARALDLAQFEQNKNAAKPDPGFVAQAVYFSTGVVFPGIFVFRMLEILIGLETPCF